MSGRQQQKEHVTCSSLLAYCGCNRRLCRQLSRPDLPASDTLLQELRGLLHVLLSDIASSVVCLVSIESCDTMLPSGSVSPSTFAGVPRDSVGVPMDEHCTMVGSE